MRPAGSFPKVENGTGAGRPLFLGKQPMEIQLYSQRPSLLANKLGGCGYCLVEYSELRTARADLAV
jgi:hypothetical protein